MARPRKRLRTGKRPASPRGLERAYQRELARLNADLVGVVRRFLARPLEAHERPDREDTAEDFAGLDFGLLRVRLGRVAAARASRLVDAMGKRIRTWTAADVARVLQIDTAKEPPAVAAILDQWRRENVDLITSIADRLHADVVEVVRDSTRRGVRVETLAKRLQERYEVSASRAALIARDQSLKAAADLNRTRMESAGISRYVWSTSRDERVRSEHQVLEGRVFSWSDPPPSGPKGERGHPGVFFQCRCTAIPVLDDDDDTRLGTVAGPRPF